MFLRFTGATRAKFVYLSKLFLFDNLIFLKDQEIPHKNEFYEFGDYEYLFAF